MTERVAIGGMSCGHCVQAVRDALSAVDGVYVEDVQIGSAVVTYDPAIVSEGEVASAIAEAGYEVIGGVDDPAAPLRP